MDKCSTELIALIFEHACASDCGKTARTLGLVSKYFRAIATPLEFRTLVIAGPERLGKTLARLKRAQMANLSEPTFGEVKLDVRHLFVCELNSRHALAMDTPSRDASRGGNFWGTIEGREAAAYYREHAVQFWRSVTGLVRNVNTTLVTLTIFQYSSWPTWNPVRRRSVSSSKVLDVLSGIYLPRLMSLTVKTVSDLGAYAAEKDSFIPPVAPCLRRLHIIAPPYHEVQDGRQTLSIYPHPLLLNVHSRFGALTHLVLCDAGTFRVEAFLSAICGSADGTAKSSAHVADSHRLPGRLISAVLQQGSLPDFACGSAYQEYTSRATKFADTLRALRIHGLMVQPPAPRYPGQGHRRYEVLLAEWERLAFAH
ncbi:hypothetical protein M0805_009735 [Coniferiporia weirii]|nr:hypothetical protein M0805_009735 [Coniferiporia weirii]